MNVHKEQPMAQVELISGVERRRRWTREEKEAHVALAFAPGVNIRAYTRQEDLAPSALYKWRQELRRAAGGFTQVVVKADEGAACHRPDIIELVFGNGIHLRIPPGVPSELASSVVKALVRQ
jgi:transposase